MLSALIPSEHSYSAVHLVAKPIDQRFVQPGPLVLGSTSLKRFTPTVDKDQPVSRRFEPSSRTFLIGEQPNPWGLLQPLDKMSPHRRPGSAPRCRLILSWGWRRSQGFGCSPIKKVRELCSNR